jgi:hypothetical protein
MKGVARSMMSILRVIKDFRTCTSQKERKKRVKRLREESRSEANVALKKGLIM